MKNFFLFVTVVGLLVFGSCSKRHSAKYSDGYFNAKNSNIHENKQLLKKSFSENNSLKVIYFGFDKSDLTTSSLKILKENVDYLTDNSNIKIILEGHTDDRGTTEYNLSLGQRRALKVKEYYVQLGIEPSRITAISYGKEKPVDLGNNELAWARNRRVETKSLI
ncbi:MAG: peptidoglycan-associated lipoprotein Pal [Endomicrobium sp.]|jgi:peptidoglycan-associated lipoprotein|nr:peptidoglycan-associated lipoprotein Pal [Endomicrobium sp.]